MKRKLPTILILLVMVLVGAMYWIDISYYTDPDSGFLIRGSVWVRYLVLILPFIMSLLGLRTVGPMAVGALRTRHPKLALLFTIASLSGFILGGFEIANGIVPLDAYRLIIGVLFLWYGVWMFFSALQFFVQVAPSPTVSVVMGILAALPYCVLTVYRILVNPTSLYRLGPLVKCYAALAAMLWFSLLLRAFYVALPRRWVRWMYVLGVFTFLFATCLELPQAVHGRMFASLSTLELLESVNMGILGLVAGCVSVTFAQAEQPVLKPKPGPLDD